VHSRLTRAINRAIVHAHVSRNVSGVVTAPKGGKPGRKSRSMSLDQMTALLAEARNSDHRLGAYAIIAVTTGLRTEELRALRWCDVDLTESVIYVVRSDRHGGDTKTDTSRRGIALVGIGTDALKAHKTRQAQELLTLGVAQDAQTLVFTREDGRAYSAESALYYFRKVLRNVEGIIPEEWTCRETRHTFVSIMSNYGDKTPREIADMVGHRTDRTTQATYREQLKPVINGAAEVIGTVFQAA
jgi:integrase